MKARRRVLFGACLLLGADAALEADGFPARAKLAAEQDREAFRGWTCALAFDEAARPEARTPYREPAGTGARFRGAWAFRKARDCADLLNIVYREALKKHDQAWRDAWGWPSGMDEPGRDVFLGYPAPVLEVRLRRATDGRFTPYATSQALREFNARRLGADLAALQDGDLLFFQHPWQSLPEHGMLYCRGTLLYHTGPSPRGPGRVKAVRLERLLEHPDPRWRPLASNPYFLGVYRWLILD